ncbi:MAG: hypothetical protein QM622_09245 [Microbacterium sp.]
MPREIDGEDTSTFQDFFVVPLHIAAEDLPAEHCVYGMDAAGNATSACPIPTSACPIPRDGIRAPRPQTAPAVSVHRCPLAGSGTGSGEQALQTLDALEELVVAERV